MSNTGDAQLCKAFCGGILRWTDGIYFVQTKAKLMNKFTFPELSIVGDHLNEDGRLP